MPTLKEALQAGASGRTMLLDLKEESQIYLNRMLEEVHSSTISGSRVILQSGSFKVLKYLRQHAPAGTQHF